MLDCIEVISPKGGSEDLKRTVCGLKRQTTSVFYSDKQQNYQNESWQLLLRQVGIIIARGTMDPRVDCFCLNQSLNEEQGIILKSFRVINIKQSLRKKSAAKLWSLCHPPIFELLPDDCKLSLSFSNCC